ncbi:MAG: hypothetical protein QXN37_01150 [Candidatus Anstonellaceae archaeon]
MRPYIFAFGLLLCACLTFGQHESLEWNAEEMLTYYQVNIDYKVPKSAKMLIGSERINVYVKGYIIGIQTKRGEIQHFGFGALENPTIVVFISDRAYEDIKNRKIGVLKAIDLGEIRIEGKTLLSSLKIEAAKRIYAAAGGDALFLGKKATPS